ncbi:MAG: coenzyme synthetase-like protein [Flavipsychrobacter sp.]|jgi:phenylacetate-CoA ligase|nr:coenzyme synthetase-like protein [Flavipsychrobacter sp.]
MSLFPTILIAQGYPFRKAQAQLRLIQQMCPAEFSEWQNRQAWDMARFHYHNNEVYRAKVGNVFPDRWNDLPVMTKQDLQKPLRSLISKGGSISQCYVGSTSGSTGTPFFFVKDKFAHAMTWAVIANRYSWYSLDFSSLQARFYGIPKEFGRHLGEKLKDILMNRRRFSVFDLSDRALSVFLQRFSRQQFKYIYGYTSSLVAFARFLIEEELVLKNICPTLKICISTSEVCTPEDHVILETAFGISHIREYGVSETCLGAFEGPDKIWKLNEESLLIEAVNDYAEEVSPGIEGNILMTSLFNRAFPMIRYQVGDVGMFDEKQVGIHRTLLSLTGRTNDIVLLPNGQTAAGLTFYYISRGILENSGVLKEFIIRQVAIDHFVFDTVTDRDLTPEEVQTITDKLSLYLVPGLKLDINRVETITRPASGKLKHFYSEIQQN